MTSLLVLGGARSGKSRYAQKRIETHCGAMVYIATAEARDDEMAERIALHRMDRGKGWKTLEAPIDLPGAIKVASASSDAILVDCLTIWLSNVMLEGISIPKARDDLIAAVTTCSVPIGLIANEVGLGIVPDNALARRFRDEAGWLNQKLAEVVDEVVFLAAGLPMMLKP
ncbi:bifunctional adenosylcobinamide kinase/adenosylcobinamide-phosphate guanylyltransferase [Novosphingobium sp. 17-62-19]|uniref:bifunctional adenosylcobinamide kinase/adenosylcobinamide-phosphate guanylyltransferase n=1 Tax=Novosphingobium sp. 17-62-19 TaxID=1970406 RepID=UPI0025D40AEF|nr:bifunctional adenosylcobinamide kinase/adenosylcobinamide-phosphate guanylyltransferase [Novosphingobium sp. 17-62-19]HQS97268.1 bifunctional adenosylcobinamide kinase/adenosylcobinamide-phosphate guanylyltransferase [Novosphingobium sp.]